MASRILALRGYGSTRFWLSAFCMAVVPTSIGSQDIAAVIAHRASSPQQSRRHLLASPFGTIEPATFSYGIRPIGTAMPRPPAVDLVNFDPRAGKARVWSIDQPVRLEQRSAELQLPQGQSRAEGQSLADRASCGRSCKPAKSAPIAADFRAVHGGAGASAGGTRGAGWARTAAARTACAGAVGCAGRRAPRRRRYSR